MKLSLCAPRCMLFSDLMTFDVVWQRWFACSVDLMKEQFESARAWDQCARAENG